MHDHDMGGANDVGWADRPRNKRPIRIALYAVCAALLSGFPVAFTLAGTALLFALAFTFTRSAWIGACCGVALLFVLRDFRLLALLPVAAGLFIVLAPPNLSTRIYSTFSLTDPSNADRVAMMKSGVRIIKDHPLTGVGPDMIIEVYPDYRDATAINALNPHLHNIPLQIAAERGLPALLVWLWFIVVLVRDLIKRKHGGFPSLANGALAAVVAMLTAGMFEYNFGDSIILSKPAY